MAHVLETHFKNNAFELNDFVELSYQSVSEQLSPSVSERFLNLPFYDSLWQPR